MDRYSREPGTKKLTPWITGVFLLGIVITLAVVFPVQATLESVLQWIEQWGAWGPVALAIVYIVACVVFVPGSLLTLAAGFLFGFWRAYLAVTTGSVLGATLAFLIGRYLARGWVESSLSGNSKLRLLDNAIAQHGFRIVLLTRLSPVFPFNVLNYALSVTRVRLRDYFFGSLLGMFPGTVLYVYLGTGLKSLSQVLAGDIPVGWLQQVFWGVGFVATLAITVVLTRLAKTALKDSEMGP